MFTFLGENIPRALPSFFVMMPSSNKAASLFSIENGLDQYRFEINTKTNLSSIMSLVLFNFIS